jgi:hypothetical protein
MKRQETYKIKFRYNTESENVTIDDKLVSEINFVGHKIDDAWL